MARDFKHFAGDLKKAEREIARFIANDAPRHVGKIAVDHFKENFNKEGFVNGGLQKWREVKRRENPKITGAASKRKILHGETLELKNSLQYRTGNAQTRIFSDVDYFEVHNEGLKAGRGEGFTMPKRQIVGQSQELDIKIDKRLESGIKRILNGN